MDGGGVLGDRIWSPRGGRDGISALTEGERRQVFLHPGSLYASKNPTRITTILGSCVAVCLWSPELGIGGMNHYLLPAAEVGADPLRYGRQAIWRLLDDLKRLGALRATLLARVFGGACTMPSVWTSWPHLGWQNVEFAAEILEVEGIPVLEWDVGGLRGR
jgi:chemotaxis protein CheD